MKTCHQIIDETIEYFRNNQRAHWRLGNWYLVTQEVVDIHCIPSELIGTKCAVGRCLENPEFYTDCSFFDYKTIPDSSFKEEYRGKPEVFWQKLQKLHDQDICWNKKGLSEYGEEYVKELKEEFNDC